MDRRIQRSIQGALAASLLLVLAVGSVRTAVWADGKLGEGKPKDWKGAAAKVDDLVAARWKTQKDLVVAPVADDAEFLRRVTLDLIGTIPTEAETTTFLKDPAPDKRAQWVDRLLASPRHADWFTTWYGNLLLGTSIRDRTVNRRTFNDWMRDQFARNRPYDEMVYDLITASGNSDVNGAVGLMSSFEFSAADAAGKTSRYFLGFQIQCAQCHDHPYDKRVKKEDFASFAAFFMTTTHRRNQSPGNPEISFDITSYPLEDLRGAMRGGRTGGMAGMRPGIPLRLEGRPAKGDRPGAPEIPEGKFLLGKTVKDVAGIDRRMVLAKWMTSKTNDWFATAFVNRMWGFLVGRGIVVPLDDFSSTNKPSNPELLKTLADEFTRSGFDVNHLIRVIVSSEAYQRSSRMPRDLERPDPNLYAVGAVKPLSVEQSFDSFFRAVGAEQELESGFGGGRMGMAGAKRGSLVDPRTFIYQLFRRSFDDDEQAEEEAFTGTIPRGLLMMNSPEINKRMNVKQGTLLKVLGEERSDRERVRRLYLTVLSREPSPGELGNALQHVHTSRTEQEGYEDLLWALCNTTEFMSNH